MEGYLGETNVDIKTHQEYSKYTKSDWAILWIEKYGQIDGVHHKTWVLDQVTRILKGCEIIVKKASWSNGYSEDRESLAEPNKEYLDWVKEMKGEGKKTYSYDEGITP